MYGSMDRRMDDALSTPGVRLVPAVLKSFIFTLAHAERVSTPLALAQKKQKPLDPVASASKTLAKHKKHLSHKTLSYFLLAARR